MDFKIHVDPENNEFFLMKKCLEAMYKELQCAVCLALLKEPKSLPCNHAYCNRCLDDISTKGKGMCPQCRKKFSRRKVYCDTFLINMTILYRELHNITYSHFDLDCLSQDLSQALSQKLSQPLSQDLSQTLSGFCSQSSSYNPIHESKHYNDQESVFPLSPVEQTVLIGENTFKIRENKNQKEKKNSCIILNSEECTQQLRNTSVLIRQNKKRRRKRHMLPSSIYNIKNDGRKKIHLPR